MSKRVYTLLWKDACYLNKSPTMMCLAKKKKINKKINVSVSGSTAISMHTESRPIYFYCLNFCHIQVCICTNGTAPLIYQILYFLSTHATQQLK